MTKSIVFVPGLLCTSALFGPQIAALSGGADCVVADHTRHDSISAIVAAILDTAPDQFALVGLSMGGYIALELAETAPERISSLVLMDTTARPDTPEQTARRNEFIALAKAEGIQAVVDRLLPVFIAENRFEDEALVGTVRKMAKDTGVETFIRQEMAIMGRRDARPNLGNVTCPTLVVVGDRDKVTPPEASEEIAAGISGARLEVVADSGHLTTLERPDAVTALLIDFLAH